MTPNILQGSVAPRTFKDVVGFFTMTLKFSAESDDESFFFENRSVLGEVPLITTAS